MRSISLGPEDSDDYPGDDGWPIHEGGITSEPGLGLVGLRFQTPARSDLLYGVAADAERVVDGLLEAGREVVR